MAVFGLKPRIFRTQVHNSVLWGQSEFTLDRMGWFYVVALQRAALETKLGSLVRTQHYNCSATANGTGVPAITAECAALGRMTSNARVKTSS
jgi:hypothetical protein